MQFLALFIFGFLMMEAISYVAHRFLFHGVLWRIHRTHHAPTKAFLELNDAFSVGFALLSIGLMCGAQKPLLDSVAFPIGLSLTVYGIFYFILHDLFTHRRFLPFKSRNKVLLTVRAAHQRHHQTVEKQGIEPFGLFVFDYKKHLKISRRISAPERETARSIK